MIAELRELLKLDDLKLDYTVEIADFDGECFTFNVRGNERDEKTLFKKIKEQMKIYQESANDFVGYIDVEDKEGYVGIFYDTGNVGDGLAAVHELMYAINEVPDVQSVVINEM